MLIDNRRMQTATIRHFASLVASAALVVFVAPLHAQTRALTADDYARAEQFLGYNTNRLVLTQSPSRPGWATTALVPHDHREWNGVLPGRCRHRHADAGFDQGRSQPRCPSAARSDLLGVPAALQSVRIQQRPQIHFFNAGGSQWTCDVEGTRCENKERHQESPSVTSPDGKRAAFIRNYNLWVRDTASGKETQLTKDGVKEYGYATDNAGWIHSDNAILAVVARFKEDRHLPAGRARHRRHVSGQHQCRPSKLDAWKYPLPGDPKIFMIERVVIDVDRARVVRLQMPADPHRSSVCDDVGCSGPFEDVEWSADGKQLAFLSSSRDHKEAQLRVADTRIGQGARRAGGEGRDVLRVRQRRAQLALSARVERGDLVLRAR